MVLPIYDSFVGCVDLLMSWKSPRGPFKYMLKNHIESEDTD